MNNKLSIFFFCSLVVTLVATEKLIQETFTLPSPPKKESHNTINEANGRLILTNNKKCAQLIKYTADFEELLIDQGDLLLRQEKGSFFVAADTKSLQEYRALQQELTNALDTCHKTLQNVKIKLKNLCLS